jgi:hypothetical protein
MESSLKARGCVAKWGELLEEPNLSIEYTWMNKSTVI